MNGAPMRTTPLAFSFGFSGSPMTRLTSIHWKMPRPLMGGLMGGTGGELLPHGGCGLPIRMALPDALFFGAIAQPFEPPRVSLRATTVPVEQPGVKLHATALAAEMPPFCQAEINAGRLSWLGMTWKWTMY